MYARRFAEGLKSPISAAGQAIISNTPELCYLTQIVLRLFEDDNKGPEDPKRFRVDISFSPGATATPLHMGAMLRDNDVTRFNCNKSVSISLPNLSCDDLESFMDQVIDQGKAAKDGGTDREGGDGDGDTEGEEKEEGKRKEKKQKQKQKKNVEEAEEAEPEQKKLEQPKLEQPKLEQPKLEQPKLEQPKLEQPKLEQPRLEEQKEVAEEQKEVAEEEEEEEERITEAIVDGEEEHDIKNMAKDLAKRYFWGGVAVVAFGVGIGLLFATMRMKQQENARRRWSNRR